MSTVMDKQLEQLVAKGEATLQILDKATAPRKTGFTDETILIKDKKILFPSIPRSGYKATLTRFFNLYINGVVDNGDHCISVVLDTISIACVTEKLFWDDADYGTPSFYTTCTGKPRDLVAIEDTSILSIQSTSPFTEDNQVKAEQARALLQEYTTDFYKDFIKAISHRIDKINDVKAAEPEEIEIRRLAGFLALTLLRSAIKNNIQMANGFLKKQYRVNLSSVVMWPPEAPFYPPSKRCLSMCEIGLSKQTTGVSQIFVKLTAKFIRLSSLDGSDQNALAYISASVLTHTARNGLGLIQMLDQVSEILRMGWVAIMRKTFYNITEHAWKEVSDFYITQLNKENVQRGFNWARVIDHGYFRGLSPKEQPYLAVIFAAIIAEVQGGGVWEAEWIRNKRAQFKQAEFIGKVMYLDSQPTLEKLQGPASSMDVANRAIVVRDRHKELEADIDTAKGLPF